MRVRSSALVLILGLGLSLGLAGCAKDPPAELDLVVLEARGAEDIRVELSNIGGSATEIAAANFRLLAANGAVGIDNYHTLEGREDRFPATGTLEPGGTYRGALSFLFIEEASRPWTMIYKTGADRVEAVVPE